MIMHLSSAVIRMFMHISTAPRSVCSCTLCRAPRSGCSCTLAAPRSGGSCTLTAPRFGCSCSPVQLQDLVAVEAGEILIRILAPASHDDDLGGGTAAGLAAEAAVVPFDVDRAQLVCSRDDSGQDQGSFRIGPLRPPVHCKKMLEILPSNEPECH
jgi:hypothetical protein